MNTSERWTKYLDGLDKLGGMTVTGFRECVADIQRLEFALAQMRATWGELKPWIGNLADSLACVQPLITRDDGKPAQDVIREAFAKIEVALAASPASGPDPRDYALAQMRATLEEVQWGANGRDTCPVCYGSREGGHDETCEIGVILAASPADGQAKDWKAEYERTVGILSMVEHPDEGPCPCCGAIFDTHNEGCNLVTILDEFRRASRLKEGSDD